MEDTPIFDRRVSDLGPPEGVPDRRVNDALKMACPFCGWSQSSVVRSHGLIETDAIRRRRQCANPQCRDRFGRPRRFPTAETVDHACLQRELELEASMTTPFEANP